MAQELADIRVNTSYVKLEDGHVRRDELIFVTAEAEYSLSNEGDVVRERGCEAHRVHVGKERLEVLRNLCNDLLEDYEEDPLATE